MRITPAELETERRARTAAEIEGRVFTNLAALAALRGGSPGSNGDAGLMGKIDSDGNYTRWFTCGDAVGTNPVKPETA